MKKRLFLVVCMIVILVFGCSEKGTSKKEEKTDDIKIEKPQEDNNLPEESEEENKEYIIKIYYINQESGEMLEQDVVCEELNEQRIWQELQKKGLLTEECQINYIQNDENEKTIELDVNDGFGNYVRSMGTAGEEEILTCVVNSFLDSYECEKIMITEDGMPLDTGHSVLDGYMQKMDLRRE